MGTLPPSQQGVSPPSNTMNPKLIFSCALPLLLCFLQTGEGIKCIECNSYEFAHCDDPFHFGDDPKTIKQMFKTDCPAGSFCRKIYQNVRGDERVIRSCAQIPHKVNESNCYKTVLEEYNTLVCQCNNEDFCNSSNMLSMSVFAIVSSAILAKLIR